jgi:hypothetical protein
VPPYAGYGEDRRVEIKYAWVDNFCGSEEKFLREKINTHIEKESLGRCGCGELKVIVSGDFVNLIYKAKILCPCNAVQDEVRGVLRSGT